MTLTFDLQQSKWQRELRLPLETIVARNLNYLHCVSKNDTDVAHYNFDTDQPISIIFGRDVAETACYLS